VWRSFALWEMKIGGAEESGAGAAGAAGAGDAGGGREGGRAGGVEGDGGELRPAVAEGDAAGRGRRPINLEPLIESEFRSITHTPVHIEKGPCLA
jgi:hypothetical protein